MKLTIELEATDGRARAGRIVTPRGVIPTPVFMPVGTRGAVKLLDTMDLDALGPPIVLGNTYHLMLRPGSELIAGQGGLHRFMAWGGHVLTDSGGYQVGIRVAVALDRPCVVGVKALEVRDGTVVAWTSGAPDASVIKLVRAPLMSAP